MKTTLVKIIGTFLIPVVVLAAGHGPRESSTVDVRNIPGVDPAMAKVELDLGILADQGTPAARIGGSGLSVYRSDDSIRGGLRLKQGTKLTVLIDNTCQTSTPFVAAIKNSSVTPPAHLRVQAYSYVLARDWDYSELVASANADDCILQIGNEAELSVVMSVNDRDMNEQWHHKTIESLAAYDIFFGPKGITQDVVVAVIDSGVNYEHPDLKDNMWKDPSGRYGPDYITNDNDPRDENGHGTHCAGLIGAAMNNGVGGTGVMGAHVKIMAIRAMDASGNGETSNIINGISYAIENGASVISISAGHKGSDAGLEKIIGLAISKGIMVIVAAGNDGNEIGTSYQFSPAFYGRDYAGALTVGAIDDRVNKSNFSNYGRSYVEIGSPGSNIYSTYGNDYKVLSGTSMATPIVSGAAALAIGLVRSRGGAVTPALIEELLLGSANKKSGLKSYFKDGNVLNLKSLATTINSRFPGDGVQPPVPTPTPTPVPTPTPLPAPAPGCGKMAKPACEIFMAINAERAKNGVPAFQPLDACTKMAESHAEDMARNNFFSHTSPTAGEFSARAKKFLPAGASSENIITGYKKVSDMLKVWMDSSAHRANILSQVFKSSGVGYAKTSSGTLYYVQCFSEAGH